MAVYTMKRIAVGMISLFVLVTVTFFLTRMMPGSPFEDGNVSASVTEAMEEEYGLRDSPVKQYRTYMTAAVAGTGLGIWKAVSKKKTVRILLSGGTLLGAGIPNFVAALLLLLVFGVTLKWFPVTGLFTPAHYVLPVLSLAFYPTAVVAEMIYNTFAEEMKKEYVVLARAKGMGFWQIAVFHVLKNAWIPVLNYLGPLSAFLLTGSFAVESIFNIPGLGREFVSSVMNRDYTLIMGLTIFMGSVVIGVNLFTDLLCAWLDPRVRNSYLEKRWGD